MGFTSAFKGLSEAIKWEEGGGEGEWRWYGGTVRHEEVCDQLRFTFNSNFILFYPNSNLKATRIYLWRTDGHRITVTQSGKVPVRTLAPW